MALDDPRFAVTYLWQMVQSDGYLLEFTTNTPCHLWMKYKSTRPGKKLVQAWRRGRPMHCTPSFDFSAAKEMEQQEAGDTLKHSFMLRPYLRPDHYYFYLYGYVAGRKAASTSCIMHLPFAHGSRKMIWSQPYMEDSGKILSYAYPLAMSFPCEFYGGVDGVTLYCTGFNQPVDLTVSIYQTDIVGEKPTIPLTSVTIDHVPDKRTSPNIGELYFPFPHLDLIFAHTYAIVVQGDAQWPGLQCFWWARESYWRYPGYRSWYSSTPEPPYTWQYDNVSVLGYDLWQKLPFYQPGPPTFEQIPR